MLLHMICQLRRAEIWATYLTIKENIKVKTKKPNLMASVLAGTNKDLLLTA